MEYLVKETKVRKGNCQISLLKFNTNSKNIFHSKIASFLLRRILGLKKDEVTKDWRILYTEELYNLHQELIK